MTVRIIMHTPEPSSGAAKYVSDLVKALVDLGEPVVLFGPQNFAYLADLSGAGARFVCSGTRSTAAAGLTARLIRNLRFFAETFVRQAWLTRSRDIIHFQFPLYFPAGLVLFVMAKVQARAIVYTAHDPLPHKWLLPASVNFIERACLRWAYSLSDRIIVHNLAARELLVRQFAQNASKIAVIPHGSSIRKPADDLFSDSDTLELLMFGSIREDKGVELAIKAVQRVNATGPKVRLLIAGSVANAREEPYWEACKRTIREGSAGIRLQEGFIPDEEVAGLLAACHAVLLPYKNFESESGVAAVALASGRAILATDSGSFSALLNAADLGIPIQSASVEAVEEAILSARSIGSQELRNKGLRGLAFARSTRSWEGIAKQTASLYAEMSMEQVEAVREPRHG